MDSGSISIKEFENQLLNLLPIFPKRIAVAVSGGVDSMVLAILLAKLLDKEVGTKVICLHVDHRLRTGSSAEAKWLAKYMEGQNIETHTLNWQHEQKIDRNIHAKAREARYNLLVTKCLELGIENLLTAHNFNDQAETVLMRVFKGSGIKGLRGIEAKTVRGRVNILRPLLTFTRESIVQTALEHSLDWVEDPSNMNQRFDRAKVRKLIQQLPNSLEVMKNLNIVAHNMSRAFNFIQAKVNEFVSSHCKTSKLGFIYFELSAFLKLDDEIALRVLKRVLLSMSSLNKELRLFNLEELLKKLRDHKANCTLLGCYIKLARGRVSIFRELQFMQKMTPISGDTYWDNRFHVSSSIPNLNIGGADTKQLPKEYWPQGIDKRFLSTIPAIYYPDGTLAACPSLNYFGSISSSSVSITRI